jgi:hypothetical protein
MPQPLKKNEQGTRKLKMAIAGLATRRRIAALAQPEIIGQYAPFGNR